MTEYFELDDDTRVAVSPDMDSACPRADHDQMTGFVHIPGEGSPRRASAMIPCHEHPGSVRGAWGRIEQSMWGHGSTPRQQYDAVVDTVKRWSRVFYGLLLEQDAMYGGFWFVDPQAFADNWPDLVLGSPEGLAKQQEIIDSEREEYRIWADGEVIGVTLERAVHVAPVVQTADGRWELPADLTEDDVEKTWEDVDSIWGNYPSEGYGVPEIAGEHFDLTDEQIQTLRELA